MKPALLNSIYLKTSKHEYFHSLNELIEFYVDKLYVLYLNVLDDAGVSNLNEKIKVKTKLPSGKIITDHYSAGLHLIDVLFDSDQYEHDLHKLDSIFLKNCQEKNKEEILDKIKYVFSEVACNTLDKKEIIKEIQHCDFS